MGWFGKKGAKRFDDLVERCRARGIDKRGKTRQCTLKRGHWGSHSWAR
jgi:hypothetical protein